MSFGRLARVRRVALLWRGLTRRLGNLEISIAGATAIDGLAD